MPDKRHKDRRGLIVYLTHEQYAKFKKKAAQIGMSMAEIVTAHIVIMTRDVTLTPEDYEEIARRIRQREASGR